MVPVSIMQWDAMFRVFAGSGEVPGKRQGAPAKMVRFDEEPWVVYLLGESQNVTGLIARGSQIPRNHLILSLAAQGNEQAPGVALPLGNGRRSREGIRYLRIAEASRRHQAYAQCVLKGYFQAVARHPVGHGVQDCQSRPQVAVRLDIG